jgi:hypothetical protein
MRDHRQELPDNNTNLPSPHAGEGPGERGFKPTASTSATPPERINPGNREHRLTAIA